MFVESRITKQAHEDMEPRDTTVGQQESQIYPWWEMVMNAGFLDVLINLILLAILSICPSLYLG